MVSVNLEDLVNGEKDVEPPDSILEVIGYICNYTKNGAFGMTSSKPNEKMKNYIECKIKDNLTGDLKNNAASYSYLYNYKNALDTLVKKVTITGKSYRLPSDNGNTRNFPQVLDISKIETI